MTEFSNCLSEFDEFSQNPVHFLIENNKAASKFIETCSSFYPFAKAVDKSLDDDPLSYLHVDGFDDEQIWQQIELLNDVNVRDCSKGTALCLREDFKLAGKSEVGVVSGDTAEPVESVNEDADSCIISDGTSSENDREETDGCFENLPSTEFEKTEVDDEFFSLRQMEKFLEMEESEKKLSGSYEDIDYFNDIPSDDDDDGGDGWGASDNEEFSDLDPGEKLSARDLKYEQFFQGEACKDSLADDTVQADMSKHEKEQAEIMENIKKLEDRALEEADWQLKGEVQCNKRPVNSLLEEVLTYQHTQRAPPEITDEHTHDLEAIIRQRIKDKAWDDVERKIKELKDPQEYKKQVVLDSEQSKLSLQEIYEKEYVSKISKEKVEKEDPAHTEINSLMSNLFKKLDALSNFHFLSAPPEPEIRVVSNLPSVAMEEVQPISHTDADILAPEEVQTKEDSKANMEKTSTDRKRERRKKAARQKARAKAKLDKLQKLADTNDKLKMLQAVKKLQEAAKHTSGRTTIIKNSKEKSVKLKSSKEFFTQLEETKNLGKTKKLK